MLIVVVLAIITVLALLGASFSYWMNADLAATKAGNDRQQAHLAAESGVARAMLLLRKDPSNIEQDPINMDKWYNNPLAFRRILVWAPDQIGGSESLADQEKIENREAWRFSVVSHELEGEGDRTRMRYGLTDETSKLNLNTATREQLLMLFTQALAGKSTIQDNVTPEALADALKDWIDTDDAFASPQGAESSYYMSLEPAFRAKNRPLETVEELLSVRWFNGRIVYGEDHNRNGYLDPNEDDGPEGLFPPDNGDGILDRGLLPYITVYSWDHNWANDNKPRLNINQVGLANPERLPSVFRAVLDEVPAEVLQFIAEIQKIGYKPRSIGELVGLQVYSAKKSNYTPLWAAYDQERNEANQLRLIPLEGESGDANTDNSASGGSGGQDGGGSDDSTGGGGLDGPNSGGGNRDQDADAGSRDGGSAADKNPDDSGTDEDSNATDPQRKNRTRSQQAVRDRGGRGGRPGGGGGRNDTAAEDESTDDDQAGQDRRGGRGRGGAGRSGDQGPGPGASQDGGRRGDREAGRGGDRGFGGGSDQGPGGGRRPGRGRDGGRGGDARPNEGRDSNTGPSGGFDRGGRGGRGPGARDGSGGQASDNPDGPNSPDGRGGRDGLGGRDGRGGRGGRDGQGGQAGDGRGGDRPGRAGDRGGRGGGGRGGSGTQPAGGPTGGGSGTATQPGGEDDSNPKAISPVTADMLPVLLDRLTVSDMMAQQVGLINVDTAPPEVLVCIPGLTEEEASAIVAKRSQLSGEEKKTPAWLVTSGVLSPERFMLINNSVTARSIQFSGDVIGFADHTGTYRRLQVVLEMQGHFARLKYFREISSLGRGYPVWDDQQSEGLTFDAP